MSCLLLLVSEVITFSGMEALCLPYLDVPNT